jgi:hypothetical protein
MGEFEQAQHLGRLVAALLAGEGNARRLAAGVELDPDTLNNATNTVLKADHERIHLVDDRPPVFEKLTGSLLGTRHQQFLALVQNKDCQFSCSEATCKGLVTRLLQAISLDNVATQVKDFSPSAARFVPIPGLVCGSRIERGQS